MKNVTLRQFRYFEALAKTGHFGHAAEISAISQPALSMQIKELERSVGTVLFERGSHGVRLTPFGETFATRVREILRAVDELDDLARAAQGRLAGRLRLGVIPTIAPYILPSVIPELTRHFPDLDIHIRESLTQQLLLELGAGAIDAAIVALPVSEPALEEVLLFSEPFVLVRPRSEAGLPLPDVERLREMRLLLLEEGHCFRDQALSFCNMSAPSARETLDASSLSTLVQMVGAGLGVTLIPDMAVDVETRSADVAVTRFAPPVPARRVGMVWRRTSPLSSQLTEIADLVRATAEPQHPST
ncbi:hydrogen peroxide-inducible genes activator [Celeribacter arenosi]|uniref:Hydrogen peroxide-inducible genes activator n=1 Tax=Celeribacter arenosi TaxID=792649 RepID=A0ABP7JRJ4_9RHOB